MEEERKGRIYVDGCFDMVHFGHANAIRQARKLGKVLVVGVHSDADILAHKGPTVYPEDERYKLVKAIKWVDEIKEGAPYECPAEYLDEINCEAIAHGDDISHSIQSGKDAYSEMKADGRYIEFKRTKGVSTTDLIRRILDMNKSHHMAEGDESIVGKLGKNVRPVVTKKIQFLPTTNQIYRFSSDVEPKPGDTIVYTSGSFDILHAGHVDFLEEASKLGDYLIVGVHTDQTTNKYKGLNHPIMNLHERIMGVAALKCVSEVLIGAPYSISALMIEYFKIDKVVHGMTNMLPDEDGMHPFQAALKQNKFAQIESKNELSTTEVIRRILRHRDQYEERNKVKEANESVYVAPQ